MSEKDFIIRRLDTDSDGRYYQAVDKEGKTLWTYPSVTTIIDGAYPTGDYLMSWIRTNGLSGQFEYEEAARMGTEIHTIIERLLNGEAVPTEKLERKVKKCVQAFIDWYYEFKPRIIQTESIVYDIGLEYAGTMDLICELDYTKGKEVYKGIYIVDYKSSSTIQDKHRVQIAAYWNAAGGNHKAATLHLGNKTKAKWSFAEFEPNEFFAQFKHFQQTFRILNPDAEPKITEYPEAFALRPLESTDAQGTAPDSDSMTHIGSIPPKQPKKA